jgi:hypothetical protein
VRNGHPGARLGAQLPGGILHVGEAVDVELEDGGGQLDAQTIARTEVLVYSYDQLFHFSTVTSRGLATARGDCGYTLAVLLRKGR